MTERYPHPEDVEHTASETVKVCNHDRETDTCQWYYRQTTMYVGHRMKRTSQKVQSEAELDALTIQDLLEWSEWK